MPFAATWMDLEIILISEVSQKEKDKYHVISLKYGKNEPIYKTETDSQKTDLWLPREKGREWEGLGTWGKQMQNVAFGVDQQWDPAEQHLELCLVTYDGA